MRYQVITCVQFERPITQSANHTYIGRIEEVRSLLFYCAHESDQMFIHNRLMKN